MAQPGALDNGGQRALYDEALSYYPADTSIAEGLVVVFDNTSGDNRSIVQPNHANALHGARAFAGVCSERGSPIAAQDKSWTAQRGGAWSRLDPTTTPIVG